MVLGLQDFLLLNIFMHSQYITLTPRVLSHPKGSILSLRTVPRFHIFNHCAKFIPNKNSQGGLRAVIPSPENVIPDWGLFL